MNRRYRIAYIVGLPHCGSTLLGMILNAHESAVSVGEVFGLHDHAGNGRKGKGADSIEAACICGSESLSGCDFWRAVGMEVERRSGLTLQDLDLQSDDPLRFADHNRLFFDSLADITGAKLIVDTSKRLNRLHALLTCTDLPLVPIHLLRDPKGQIYSLLQRGHNSVLEPAAQYRKTTLKTLRLLRRVRHLRLRYESLLTAPEEALQRVMRGLGLTFQEAQLNWVKAERHGLPNSRAGRPGDDEILLNDAWRENMGMRQRAFITILTFPAIYATRRY